jgi:GSH-dependent disulfide-bond oxidoreductase
MLGDTYTLVAWRVGLGPHGPALHRRWRLRRAVQRQAPPRSISARPAAQRAEALKERSTFKTEMDEEAKRAMFPQDARLTAA